MAGPSLGELLRAARDATEEALTEADYQSDWIERSVYNRLDEALTLVEEAQRLV